MLLLGFVALMQSIFIPGYLVIKLFKIKTDSILNKVILTFSISLFANYLIVTVLLILGIYIRPVLFIVFGIELLGVMYLSVRTKSGFNIKGNLNDFYNRLNEYLRYVSTQCNFHRAFIDIYFTLILTVLLFSLGTIFYFVDTVNNIHWNTWTMDIARNSMPQYKSHFPQLIPCNWSVYYLAIDKINIHFFPKLIAPFFLAGILLIFADLGVKFRDFRYIISGCLSFVLYIMMNSLVFIVDGNADIPVAFFSLFTYYVYKNYDISEYDLPKYVLLTLAAIAAPATKLAGMYIFAVASVFMFFQIVRNYKRISIKSLSVFGSVSIVLGIANIFWYFSDPVTMAQGLHQPEYTSPHYLTALSKSSSMVMHHLGIPVVLFLFGGLLLSFKEKKNILFNIVLVIVPFALWALKFSPDFRNLSFVVPFLSMSAVWGWLKVSGKNSDNLKGIINNWKVAILMIPANIIFVTQMFYELIYDIYMMISRYYFSYSKINLTIEYGPFIHIDFIRNFVFTFGAVVIILNFIKYIQISNKVVIYTACVLLFATGFIIREEQILKRQEFLLKKVDYRNYYSFLYRFNQNSVKKSKILTNDNYLAEMNLPLNVEFELLINPADTTIIRRYELISVNQSIAAEKDMNQLLKNTTSLFDTLFQYESHLLLQRKPNNSKTVRVSP